MSILIPHMCEKCLLQKSIKLWQNTTFIKVTIRCGVWKLVMVNNQGDADFLHSRSVCVFTMQCQVLTCVKHSLLQKFIEIRQNKIFTIIITIYCFWKLVMASNQDDTDFLHSMKDNMCLHYANDKKSSHFWNVIS